MLEEPGGVLVPVAASFHPVTLCKSTRIILSPRSDLWDGTSHACGSFCNSSEMQEAASPHEKSVAPPGSCLCGSL